MQYPLCSICKKSLTENERDPEGGTLSSAHFACTLESPTGTYWVVTPSYPGNPGWGDKVTRYGHATRAVWQADSLERWNPGHRFYVVEVR